MKRKLWKFLPIIFVLASAACANGVTPNTATALSASPTAVSFDSQTVNTTKTVSVTVKNTGSKVIQIKSASTSPSVFKVTNWVGQVTLKPLQSLVLGLSFTPTSATTYTGTLAIGTNTSAADTVALSGTGTASTSTTQIAVAVSPASTTVQTGGSQQFSASVTGTTNTGVTWLVNNLIGGDATVGTISNSGVYTAPSTVPYPSTVTVTARSVADTTKSGSGSVAVQNPPAPIAVTVSPTSAVLQAGLTQQFGAQVTGTTSTAVTWLVNNVAGGSSTTGTITTSGLYSAPASLAASTAFTVTARSAADTTKAASAAITVNPTPTPVAVTITPTSTSLQPGQTQQFSASVTGTTNTGVNWLVNGVKGGSSTTGIVSTTGLFTAPSSMAAAATVTVSAQSAYDGSKSANASVAISASSVGGRQFYVSTTGNDANSGTSSSPWRTIQHADAVVKPGDVVHVASGTYNVSAPGGVGGAITTVTSGTATAPIRYVSDTKWGAKIVSSSTGYTFVWYNKANYVDIVGFDVSCPSCSVGIRNFASNVRMIGNHVHDIPGEPGCTSNGGAGINNGNYSAYDNDIIGNVVHDIGPKPTGSCNKIHGIYHSNLRGHIWNNITYNNSGWGITTWHAANAESIVNNVVFANGGISGTAYVGGGILIGDGDDPGGVYNDNVVVANNIIYKNPGIGLREYGYVGSNNTYANNLIYGNGLNTFELNNGNTPANTVSADPQFVNYTGNFFTGDYHLKSTSPAVNKGADIHAPLYDFDGGARPVGSYWDIGSFEYSSAVGTWPYE